MKKLLNQRDEQNEGAQDSDRSLSLMHLSKLFNELKQTRGQLVSGSAPSKYDTQAHQAVSEYEQKIYRLLPLFIKVLYSTNCIYLITINVC